MKVERIADRTHWNSLVASLSMAHILQTWEWGEFKQRTTGWLPTRYAYTHDDGTLVATASVLVRQVGPLRLLYVPKGPIFARVDLDLIAPVLDHLQDLARRGGVWLKIDPDIVIATGTPPDTPEDQPDQPNPTGQAMQAFLQGRGWRFSHDQVQFRNTLTLDLTHTEDDLLAGMNQSTRRKIRLAEKREVTVREAAGEADWQALYNLYTTTGERQGFIVRPWDYYRELWADFAQAGYARILLATFQEQVLGGIVLFHFGQRVWYFYGMSSNEERDRQPNYALQWAAIRWAKAQGYRVYDWWGAPNTFSEDDSMWGVYRFKEGFGSQVVRTLGAWDYAPYPPLYWLYTQAAPRFIGWLRRRGSA